MLSCVQVTKELQGEFRPVTIDELEGRQRRDLEERLIAEDARKHKERKESDMPGILAEQAAQQAELGSGQPSRRFKMMLPAPALPEGEYAQAREGQLLLKCYFLKNCIREAQNLVSHHWAMS
jgi:pre-mRNA-splicing factor CDC5/CEF1